MSFRKSNYSINPFKSNNSISKYLLWASDYHINKMRLSNAFLFDGTFIRPYGYYQTIIIMYLEKYTKKFIPGVYILASNKTEFIYNDSIKSFKNILTNDNEKEINLVTITLDLENKLINSVSNIFPNIRIIGCYFHHKQCLRRYAQKLGLLKKNIESETNSLINNELGLYLLKIMVKKRTSRFFRRIKKNIT